MAASFGKLEKPSIGISDVAKLANCAPDLGRRRGLGALASAFKPKPRLVHNAHPQPVDVSLHETSPLIASGA